VNRCVPTLHIYVPFARDATSELMYRCTSVMPQKHADWRKNRRGNSHCWRTHPMPDTPTPGQTAYDAYCLVIFGERPDLSHTYDCLAARTQRAWEAAAEAVRAMREKEEENTP
jgi:hypothetical protein